MRYLPRFVTKRGLGFTLAAVGLFITGDITRTGWVQIADALFWGAIFLSAIMAPLSSGGLTATPRFSSRGSGEYGAPSQGDDVSIDLEVVNHRPWPRFGVTIAFDLYVNDRLVSTAPSQRVKFHLPFLAPGATTRVVGSYRLERRGVHRLAGGVAVSDAPFGLFRRSQRQDAESSVLVYPSPADVEMPPSRLVQAGERPAPLTARTGEEVAGSRPYATGDAMRSIHWRNSARAGRLMTKAYSAVEENAPVLIVGRGATPSDANVDAESGLDDRCRVAAGVAYVSGKTGVPLSMVVGRDLPRLSWDDLRSHLATLTVGSMASTKDELDTLPPGSTVAVVLDVDDHEGIEHVVNHAPRMAATTVWLLSKAGDEFEWRLSRVEHALKSVGASVAVVERPLRTMEE